MSGCARCGGEITHDRVICPGCHGRLRGYLVDVPVLLAELDITITRQASKGDGGSGDGVDFHLGASAARDVLCHTLARWVRAWEGEAGMQRHPTVRHLAETPVGQAALLLTVRHLAAWQRAPELVDDVASAVLGAWEAVDRREGTVFIGWCPGPGSESDCGTALYVRPGLVVAHCPSCGEAWPVEESRAALLADATEVTAPAATLAKALGIPSATIRGWRHSGKLRQAIDNDGNPAVNDRNQPLYRLSDVRSLHLGMPVAKRA